MSEEEIMRVEYEAIKKFCRGDKTLVGKVATELGAHMREYIVARYPQKVSCDELYSVIESASKTWDK